MRLWRLRIFCMKRLNCFGCAKTIWCKRTMDVFVSANIIRVQNAGHILVYLRVLSCVHTQGIVPLLCITWNFVLFYVRGKQVLLFCKSAICALENQNKCFAYFCLRNVIFVSVCVWMNKSCNHLFYYFMTILNHIFL